MGSRLPSAVRNPRPRAIATARFSSCCSSTAQPGSPRWATAAGAIQPVTRSPANPCRPVAIQSGKRKVGSFHAGATSSCPSRSAASLTPLDTGEPSAHARHAATRAHDHPRALRTLGRARRPIVPQSWHDRTPYDPARRRPAVATHHRDRPNLVKARPHYHPADAAAVIEWRPAGPAGIRRHPLRGVR